MSKTYWWTQPRLISVWIIDKMYQRFFFCWMWDESIYGVRLVIDIWCLIFWLCHVFQHAQKQTPWHHDGMTQDVINKAKHSLEGGKKRESKGMGISGKKKWRDGLVGVINKAHNTSTYRKNKGMKIDGRGNRTSVVRVKAWTHQFDHCASCQCLWTERYFFILSAKLLRIFFFSALWPRDAQALGLGGLTPGPALCRPIFVPITSLLQPL